MICVFGPGMNAHMESVGLNLSFIYSEKKFKSNIHEDSLSFPMLLWESKIFVRIKNQTEILDVKNYFKWYFIHFISYS